MNRRILALLLAALLVLSFAACGKTETLTAGTNADAAGVANDYYIDLTDLGMKLTIYLRIGADGSFLFSNTTAFEVNKSAGTVHKTDGEYLMVYTSVNGEEKSISDGLTSKFVVLDDGSLDFSVCERIYYGTASATSTAADDPSIKLIAQVIPENYEAPSEESAFTKGTYTAAFTADDGMALTYQISFFDDSSYLIFALATNNGQQTLFSEVGRYGVSTTQLALNPQGENRVSNDVIDEKTLSVSMPMPNSEERTVLTATKTEKAPGLLGEYHGSSNETQVSAALKLFTDGSFEVTANGFSERGLFAPNSASKTFKIYPDHPTTGIRGVNQVTTVPAGMMDEKGGKLVLSEFRVRTSESLNREKCSFE